MVLTSLFIIISLGIVAFAIITRPFHGVALLEADSQPWLQDEDLPAAHEKTAVWLNDLELEYSAGKLDKQDYDRQKSALEKEISRIEEQMLSIQQKSDLSDGKKIESMITDRRKTRVERSAGFCVKCGAPLTTSDLFCSKCGLKLK